MVAIVALLGLAACSTNEVDDFGGLSAGIRVYDETGTSLSGADMQDLQASLDTLQVETSADVIAYVRELDADPDETLEQVESLQQAWVATTGVDQDIAGAILINREPGADDEARAGIYVGSTYDDGNVPRSEQEAIVADELIPPLTSGDVAASLTNGIERLDSSIRNGPPRTGLNDFADGPGSTWLPWAGLVLILLVSLGAWSTYRRRAIPTVPELEPTTRRPSALNPALAGFLATGTPQASIIPATVLEFAARDGLVIEPDEESAGSGEGTVQLRILDDSVPRDEIERLIWHDLREQATDGVVDSDGVAVLSGATSGVFTLIKEQARLYGWLNENASRARWTLGGLTVVAAVVTIFSITVIAGGAPLMLISAIPAGIATVAIFVLLTTFSGLSVTGLDAARPWEAYRNGLKRAAHDESTALDLDAVLTDVVAFNLGTDFKDRLDAATDGSTASSLRAFTAPSSVPTATNAAFFPWIVFSGSFASSSGGTGAGASGAGAGGGGGAAGST